MRTTSHSDVSAKAGGKKNRNIGNRAMIRMLPASYRKWMRMLTHSAPHHCSTEMRWFSFTTSRASPGASPAELAAASPPVVEAAGDAFAYSTRHNRLLSQARQEGVQVATDARHRQVSPQQPRLTTVTHYSFAPMSGLSPMSVKYLLVFHTHEAEADADGVEHERPTSSGLHTLSGRCHRTKTSRNTPPGRAARSTTGCSTSPSRTG